jgi:hypothetical protein
VGDVMQCDMDRHDGLLRARTVTRLGKTCADIRKLSFAGARGFG